MQELIYLWAAAALVALFGIWYCLFTRLPNLTQKGERPMSKKEREAQKRADEIAAAAEATVAKILAQRGISAEETSDSPAQVQPTKPVSTAEALRQKYAKEKVTK